MCFKFSILSHLSVSACMSVIGYFDYITLQGLQPFLVKNPRLLVVSWSLLVIQGLYMWFHRNLSLLFFSFVSVKTVNGSRTEAIDHCRISFQHQFFQPMNMKYFFNFMCPFQFLSMLYSFQCKDEFFDYSVLEVSSFFLNRW